MSALAARFRLEQYDQAIRIMQIKPSDFVTLSRLLDEALALQPAQRESWLATLPAESMHLVPRLRDMLENAASTDDSFLSAPSLRQPGSSLTDVEAGGVVHPYRLVREIGRGGMGTVWLAERIDGGPKRPVALKLPRLAWGSGLAERMARETDIGALLEHPNIARLYDAGVDEHGRPFLALEYIDGVPLDAWCAGRKLSIPERLQLFMQVARAVAYAHGRLVVHRDIKPANVLVSREGHVHLLDFGIAKLVHEAGPEAVPDGDGLTQSHGRPLTPRYASPEQLCNKPITVASDIYSLGVLLYQLLTGVCPHGEEQRSLAALEEAVLQEDAPLASSRVRDAAAARSLRGDLDAILAKALRREPAERYPTVDEFVRDIERHLAGDVVVAQPDRAAYRLGKALRKHRLAFASGAAVAASLVVGAALAVGQAQRANAEAKGARAAAERAAVVKDFVVDVFKINSRDASSSNEARQLPVELLLDRGARLIETRFEGRNDLQAELFGVVTRIMLDSQAAQLALRYSAKHLDALAAGHPQPDQLARAHLQHAEALRANQREAEAEVAVGRALAAAPSVGERVRARLMRTELLRARPDAKGALAEVELIEREGPALATLPASMRAELSFARAQALATLDRLDEARPVFEQAIAKAAAAESEGLRLASRFRLAYAQRLLGAGFTVDAKAMYAQGLSAMYALGGPDDLEAALAELRAVSGLTSADAATFEEAQRAFDKTIAILDRQGARAPAWLRADVEHDFSCIALFYGDVAQGHALAVKSAAVLRQITGNPTAGTCLAWSQMMAGRHEEAEREYQQLLASVDTGNACASWCRAHTYMAMAHNRLMQGSVAAARELLAIMPELPQLQGATEAAKTGPMFAVRVERARIELDAGRFEAALALLEGVPDGRYMINRAEVLRAESLCRLGRPDAALPAMRAWADSEEANPRPSPWLADMRARAAFCELQAGHTARAAALAQRAREAFQRQPGVSPAYMRVLLEVEKRLSRRGVLPRLPARSRDQRRLRQPVDGVK